MAPTTLQEYLKGRMPPADFIVRVCERLDINPWWLLAGKGEMELLQPAVVSDPAPVYRTKIITEGGLEAKLLRIVAEGNQKKIKAVEAQLDLLDPGENKQQQPPAKAFGSHVSKAARREAAAIINARIELDRKVLEADLLDKDKGHLTGT